jgi:hypothetical protein
VQGVWQKWQLEGCQALEGCCLQGGVAGQQLPGYCLLKLTRPAGCGQKGRWKSRNTTGRSDPARVWLSQSSLNLEGVWTNREDDTQQNIRRNVKPSNLMMQACLEALIRCAKLRSSNGNMPSIVNAAASRLKLQEQCALWASGIHTLNPTKPLSCPEQQVADTC